MTYTKDTIEVMPLPIKVGRRFIDMTHQQCGYFTVLGYAGTSPHKCPLQMWWCECVCGDISQRHTQVLRKQSPSNCGCIEKRRRLDNPPTSRHPLYGIWKSMWHRCNNPRNHAFHNYGGRGINLCERWHTFSNFVEDMDNRPTRHHTIDRIDNNRGYSPENCQWATRKEQGNNTRLNHHLTYQGRTHTITQWAEEFDIPASRVLTRLRAGWDIEDVLFKPPLTPSESAKRAHNPRKRFLVFNGESRSISEWAKELQMSRIKIVKRLRRGWTVNETLSRP